MTVLLSPKLNARRIAPDAVLRRLDDDESAGYAVAMFTLAPGQAAWQPDDDRPDFIGPVTVVYERQFGSVTASAR